MCTNQSHFQSHLPCTVCSLWMGPVLSVSSFSRYQIYKKAHFNESLWCSKSLFQALYLMPPRNVSLFNSRDAWCQLMWPAESHLGSSGPTIHLNSSVDPVLKILSFRGRSPSSTISTRGAGKKLNQFIQVSCTIQKKRTRNVFLKRKPV